MLDRVIREVEPPRIQDDSTLNHYLAIVNDLTVITGRARLVERRSERGTDMSDEQLRGEMRVIQEAVERIRVRL